MATQSQQPSGFPPSPIQRPPSSSYLAFVPYDGFWWPAAVYQSYSQAMHERHEEMPSKVKRMLFRKIVNTNDQGMIAQVLGHDNLWIDVQEQKDIFIHLRNAQMQCTLERLGQEKYDRYQCAIDETMIIMDREDYASPPSKKELSEKFSEKRIANHITPGNHESNIASSKRKNTDGRIWGCEKPNKRAKKSSPRPVSSPDTEPRRRRTSKKTSLKKTERTPKVNTQQQSSEFLRRAKFSPQSDKTSENFYVWKPLWEVLSKERGWSTRKARNPLMDWIYVPPGVDVKVGTSGKDYFESKDEVIEWAKRVQLREQIVGITDESSVDTRASSFGSTDEEESHLPCSSDDETSTASSVQPPKRALTFTKAWPFLQNQGWYIEPGDDTDYTYYIRPGKSPARGTKGVDYFGSPTEVIEWLYETGQANQVLNEDDILSLGVQAEPEDTDSSGEDDTSQDEKDSEPETDSNVKSTKRGTGRKNGPKESKTKKNAAIQNSKKKTQRKKEASEKQRNEKKNSKMAVVKKEWFHEDDIPPFASCSNSIWNILKDSLKYRFIGGEYALPTEYAALSDCPNTFRLDSDLRKFLCKNGIPNYDENKLSVEQRTNLLRWVRFANVPVNSNNSTYKLRDVNVLTEEGAKVLLKKIGFDEVDSSFYHGPADKMFESLEDVRVFIQASPELMVRKEDEEIRQRSIRNKQEKLPLGDDEVLLLRVWAAMSETPLPSFAS
mmetsp:Transcript_27273/g.41244  ORF Transcript_27273/g.41244 Transcript_27273/m.41244 type:complete len:722 (-) Transcript_27273:219-2384(-)